MLTGRLRQTLTAQPGRSEAVARARIRLFPIGLTTIVVLAAILRLWSIDFGLPLITHPDEPLIYDAADRMISNRTLNPHWFRYPAFIIDIEAAILTVVFVLDKTLGLSDDTIATLAYGGGRIVMAAFGIATVALTGLLGRRVARLALASSAVRRWSDVAGLVAAGLLAVSFIHVKDSHYLKPDIPTGFFTALALWFTLRAWDETPPQPLPCAGEGLGRGLWPGVAIGLAGAAKYTGAVVAVVPVVALLLLWASRKVGAWSAVRTALGMAVVSIAVFLAFNPYVVLAPGEFLSPVDGIRAEINHYRSGHDGAEGNDSWRWYLAELWRNGFGPLLTPLVLLGGAMAVWRLARGRDEGRRVLWLVIVFPLVYYAMIARYPVRFDRQLIPILPYLAILGGFGVASTLALVERIDFQRRSVTATAAILLVALLATPMAVRAVEWNVETGRTDTRYAALDWIEAHVPRNAHVVREWHTPPVTQAGYRETFIRAAVDQPLAWYRAIEADYLVLSSFMYQRYLDDPARYPTEADFYKRLLALPNAISFDGANGPVIIIFRLEDAAPAFAARDA